MKKRTKHNFLKSGKTLLMLALSMVIAFGGVITISSAESLNRLSKKEKKEGYGEIAKKEEPNKNGIRKLTEEEKKERYNEMVKREEKRKMDNKSKSPNLIVENQENKIKDLFITSKLTISNFGNLACKNVSLKVEYMDKYGSVLESKIIAVTKEDEVINIKSSKDFRVVTKITPNLKETVNVRITITNKFIPVDWKGDPV